MCGQTPASPPPNTHTPCSRRQPILQLVFFPSDSYSLPPLSSSFSPPPELLVRCAVLSYRCSLSALFRCLLRSPPSPFAFNSSSLFLGLLYPSQRPVSHHSLLINGSEDRSQDLGKRKPPSSVARRISLAAGLPRPGRSRCSFRDFLRLERAPSSSTKAPSAFAGDLQPCLTFFKGCGMLSLYWLCK